MKTNINFRALAAQFFLNLAFFLLLGGSLFLSSCEAASGKKIETPAEAKEGQHAEEAEEVHLSAKQVEILGIKTGPMPMRNMSSYVEASGELDLFPQNQALVTPLIGASIASIEVVEGDKVRKGQVLARLRHPDLLQLQMDYLDRWHRLPVLEQEYLRQKELYEKKVASAKVFEDAKATRAALEAELKGLEARLRMLGMNPERVQKNEFYQSIPVLSPVPGYVRKVLITMGQYVQPETPMFDIVNNERIHVDIMVFEKDMYKVKEGQRVKFYIETLPDEELEATIHAIGKAFEEDPKALHMHAEIENKRDLLIPGTYVRARIITEDEKTYALPEEALVRDGNRYFFFTAKKPADEKGEWQFYPVEAVPGIRVDGWVAVKLFNTLPEETEIALNSAYYLFSEMKKGEMEHDQ